MGIMDTGSASPRVLVVDDDPDVLASLERGLRLSGFEVATAVDGADTFSRQHATTFRPDGRLQMLDNEHGRGLILSLDEVAHTARVDASFSAGQSTCGPQGTTVDTAAGHTLVGCSGPALREYDTGPDPVFSSSLVCDNGGGGGGGPGPSGSVRWYPLDGW